MLGDGILLWLKDPHTELGIESAVSKKLQEQHGEAVNQPPTQCLLPVTPVIILSDFKILDIPSFRIMSNQLITSKLPLTILSSTCLSHLPTIPGCMLEPWKSL